MRSFIRGPNDYDDDEEDEFVDPDLVEPIFFPVDLVELDADATDEEEEEGDGEGVADDENAEDGGAAGDDDDGGVVVPANADILGPPPQVRIHLNRNVDIMNMIRGAEQVSDDNETRRITPVPSNGDDDGGGNVVQADANISVPHPPPQILIDFRNGDIAIGLQVGTDDNGNRMIIPLPQPFHRSIVPGTDTPSILDPANVSTAPVRDSADFTTSSSSGSDNVQVIVAPAPTELVPCEQATMKRNYDTAHSGPDPDALVTLREPKRPMKEENISSQDQAEDEIEIYSNPFVSTEEGVVEEEALRGDRIGQTIYSERHILKILMKWIEELPKYSGAEYGANQLATSDADAAEEVEDCESKKLERDFKKEMSLLWDMSSEPDIMTYLVSKGIFGIVRDSLLASSRCDRLTEISLGILANVLSSSAMTKQLSRQDSFLKLIQTVVSVGSGTSCVPILLQVLAVLRRITWSMRHDSLVDTWISDTVTSPQFLTMLTLILKGSTNRILIKESVMVVFSLLETLIPDGDKEEGEDCGSMDARVEALATEPLVTSLCEGLQELLKVPEGEVGMMELLDDVQRIPPDIQLGLRSGLGTLCYIQKIPTGKITLCAEKATVIRFVIDFFAEFSKMTEDLDKGKAAEYMVAGLDLLAFCHTEFSSIQPNAILHPVAATQKLMTEGVEEIVTGVGSDTAVEAEKDDLPLLCVLHEHLAQLRLKFGAEAVRGVFEEEVKKTGNTTMLKFFESIDERVRVHAEDKEGVSDA